MTTAEPGLRTIVAATDFSPAAEAGLAWARALARRHGAAVHLVHAVQPPPVLGTDVPVAIDVMDDFVDAARHKLDDLAQAWGQDGIEVHCRTAVGSPWRVVVEAAREVGADLVVIATRGHSGLKHLFLGSTTRRVIQHARCPVLSVRPDTAAPPDLATGAHPRNLLLPAETSEHAAVAAAAVMRLFGRAPDGCQVLLLQTWQLPAEYHTYGLRNPAVGPAWEQEVRERLAAKLEREATALRAQGWPARVEVVEGFPTPTIVDRATDTGADLVAMVTHGSRGWEHLVLGSIAERVATLAPCPVLTVRLPEEDAEPE